MATAFAPAIAKSLSIIYSLLYSSLLYFVDCFAGNTRKCCFQCISARICVQNGISAPVILFFVVFWGNCVCCLARPFYQLFSTKFSTFRVISVFPRRFSAVIHGNDRKCIKKCISAPKMSFYENNRAGNVVLSAFPGKILQKTAIKKRASRPSCARNTGRLVLLCGSCWGVLSESGS